MSNLRGTDVAIEASWRRRLLRYYFKLLPWILLVAMLTVGTLAVSQGQNPYITFAVAGGIYVLVEAGRWLPFLLGTPLTRSMLRIFAWSLTDLAVLLAGSKRRALRAEWRAHLAGESDHDPVTWRNFKEALGFVASAIRCRRSDAADAAWTPVDGGFGEDTTLPPAYRLSATRSHSQARERRSCYRRESGPQQRGPGRVGSRRRTSCGEVGLWSLAG